MADAQGQHPLTERGQEGPGSSLAEVLSWVIQEGTSPQQSPELAEYYDVGSVEAEDPEVSIDGEHSFVVAFIHDDKARKFRVSVRELEKAEV